ncbi:hypothetical protein GGR56DRAFT_100832 [Xylariaceae sp. FL0804]|nr:hypothetical protein GGR56DRAFT_100832 [Xylariaceae sp. FL0804]
MNDYPDPWPVSMQQHNHEAMWESNVEAVRSGDVPGLRRVDPGGAGSGSTSGCSGASFSSGARGGAGDGPRPNNIVDNTKRSAEDGDPDDGGGGGGDGATAARRPGLGCPFYLLYGSADECGGTAYKHHRYCDIRLHMHRKHVQPMYCPTCGEVFGRSKTAEEKHAAHLSLQACTPCAFQVPAGPTHDELAALTDDAMSDNDPGHGQRRLDEQQKWFSWWKQLFPDERPPESPYVTTQLEDTIRWWVSAEAGDGGMADFLADLVPDKPVGERGEGVICLMMKHVFDFPRNVAERRRRQQQQQRVPEVQQKHEQETQTRTHSSHASSTSLATPSSPLLSSSSSALWSRSSALWSRSSASSAGLVTIPMAALQESDSSDLMSIDPQNPDCQGYYGHEAV